MVALTAPYIPGFLAFREVEFLEEKLEKLKKDAPHFFPQVKLQTNYKISSPNVLHNVEFQFGMV